jgi:hypothetical protein
MGSSNKRKKKTMTEEQHIEAEEETEDQDAGVKSELDPLQQQGLQAVQQMCGQIANAANGLQVDLLDMSVKEMEQQQRTATKNNADPFMLLQHEEQLEIIKMVRHMVKRQIDLRESLNARATLLTPRQNG